MKTKILILAIIVTFVHAGCNNKKTNATATSAAPTIDTLVKAPDYGMMIVANVTVKPDKVKNFTEAAKEMIENSNKEAGCKFYRLYQSPYDNTKFVFVEQYQNQAAVDTHFAADYFKAFGPKIADFVTEPAKIKIVTVAKEVNQ